MSYVRGDPYIWRGGDNDLHIWSKHLDDEYRVKQRVSSDIFDQMAVVRVAEMIEEGRLEKAIERAANSGNAGSLHKKTFTELLHRVKSMLKVRCIEDAR